MANERCNTFWRAVVVLCTVAGLALTMSNVFFWNPFGGSFLRNQFLYLLLAVFLPLVYVLFPAHKGARGKVPWYDVVLFGAAGAVNTYFAYNAENITTMGWDYTAPPLAVAFSFVQWALVLEALRRAAGWAVSLIALLFSVYPMFAGIVPITFLQGIQFDLQSTARIHVLGVDSILGLPLQAAATILVGFLFFGVVLQHTGGATFFYQMAQSLFGHARGGSAKVAVTSSASMGMMSGSAVSNVLTTGPMTIPAMKQSGFSGRYAAGVEATASSGGSITPPIMGTAAFLMVSFVGVPYSEVALAAAIPALLYYVGIYTQIDAHSGKAKLGRTPRAELPKALPILAAGWPYLTALAGLIGLLVVYKNEAQAPFIIVAALLAISVFRRSNRLTTSGAVDLLFGAGKTIAEIIGIIAGVGLIVGGLSMSGVSLSLARELVSMVGDNVLLILLAGAVTSFIMGMGMTVSAVYVFLAIVMAPALVQVGVDPIAAHLFVIYWATVSYITPPVALASFAAAGIAGTRPVPTSLTAMRLGMVKYVIPFCFALNPVLVGHGSLGAIGFSLVMAIIGVVLMGCSFEGWLIGVERRMPPAARVVGFLAGLAMLAPEVTSSLVGLGVAVALTLVLRALPSSERGHDAEADADAPAERSPETTRAEASQAEAAESTRHALAMPRSVR